MEIFRPKLRLVSIFDLDLRDLSGRGIRGIVVDLDNTLLPYGSREVTETVIGWVRDVRGSGFAAAMVTNNRNRRVREIAARLEIPVAEGRAKPSRSMLRHAMALMGTRPEETAMVGDQLLTDVLAGNRLGLYTVLVTPLGVREFPMTRFISRSIERLLLRLLDVPPADRRPD